jgi:hypothetical protein
MIGFVILSYDTPLFIDKIIELAENDKLYIHPKYYDQIKDQYKKYVIKNIIPTSWGNINLVTATINLLKEAYNNECEHYILLSGDTYPIYSKNDFMNLFDNLDLSLSTFDFWRKIQIKEPLYINDRQITTLYKTSQWWMLTKKDVTTILNKYEEYIKLFESIKMYGAPDELFFLTLLQNENNNYIFNDSKIIYTEWMQYVDSYHPIIFNKLIDKQYIDIKNNNSLFIRKCLQSFEIAEYNIKKILCIILITKRTNQKKITLINFNEIDIIIVSELKITEINEILRQNCLNIIFTFKNLFLELIIEICMCHSYMINKWDFVIFVPEIFDINAIMDYILSEDSKKCDKLYNLHMNNLRPRKFVHALNNNIINAKMFKRILDNDRHIAHHVVKIQI